MIKQLLIVLGCSAIVAGAIYFSVEAYTAPKAAECAAKGGQLARGLGGIICVAVLK